MRPGESGEGEKEDGRMAGFPKSVLSNIAAFPAMGKHSCIAWPPLPYSASSSFSTYTTMFARAMEFCFLLLALFQPLYLVLLSIRPDG